MGWTVPTFFSHFTALHYPCQISYNRSNAQEKGGLAMEIPVRVQQLAELLQSKGLTPKGYGETEEHFILQVAESA
ncbi:MAG: hypothetical protein NZT92_06540 [Abditibacteriales bacterium]|nr:hypothetical protein [Abditibacteriales bacterium]MDW8365602.1 hypothetical protein [Abditibacteriales bacterium]